MLRDNEESSHHLASKLEQNIEPPGLFCEASNDLTELKTLQLKGHIAARPGQGMESGFAGYLLVLS